MIDIQYLYKLILVFLYASFATYAVMPYALEKMRKYGYIVPDKSMRFKSFKNMICTLMPLTEKQATIVILGITTLFSIIGILVF